MAYLGKGRKEDLVTLALELKLTVEENCKVLDLKTLIINSENYDEEFTKELLTSIINIRKEVEQKELEQKLQKEKEFNAAEKEKERLFEIEKLKLQAILNSGDTQQSVLSNVDTDLPKLELKKLIPSFNAKTDDMSLFLNLFEKQLTFLTIPESKWVVYLIGLLPSDIAMLIAKENNEVSQDYQHVKQILLKRFKISGEKFRQLFSKHQKPLESTWRDFSFDLRNYFEGWISELKVQNFEQLKDLMICDQIKKRTPPNYKEHFLDVWNDWVNPSDLADKLDAYEENISTKPKSKLEYTKKEFPKNQLRSDNSAFSRKTRPSDSRFEFKSDNKPPLSCYGCGKPGFIKSKCPSCSPTARTESAELSSLHFKSFSLAQPHRTLLKISINGFNGIACADTGATNTIAGEMLYQLLKERGTKFETTVLNVTLADGIERETEVHQAEVDIYIEGRVIKTKIFALPTAKNNRTLLGTDFLQQAGVVLNLPKHHWYFSDKPRQKYSFTEDPFPEILKAEADFNSIQLREDEGKHLTENQKSDLNDLIEEFEDIFQPGEEATPYIQHYINTGDNPPVSMPPYRLSPEKKENFSEVARPLSNLTKKNVKWNFNLKVKSRVEEKQDRYKSNADQHRRSQQLKVGDQVWVASHPYSDAKKGRTTKFMPRRDGPYIIVAQRSPTSYTVALKNDISSPLGNYHVSSLTPYVGPETIPVVPIRKRGRPRKPTVQRDVPATPNSPDSSSSSPTQRRGRRKFPEPVLDDEPHDWSACQGHQVPYPPRRIQPPRRATCLPRTVETG